MNLDELEKQLNDAQIKADEEAQILKEKINSLKAERKELAFKNDQSSVKINIETEGRLKIQLDSAYDEVFKIRNQIRMEKERIAEEKRKEELERQRLKKEAHDNFIKNQMNEIILLLKEGWSRKEAGMKLNISPDQIDEWYNLGQWHDYRCRDFYLAVRKIEKDK